MASSEMTQHVAQLYRSIYAVVRRIPTGRVATYGQVAELAGIPGGGRVAGAAMKTSKRGDRLPWQRVIGKASKNRGRIAIHDPVGAAVQRQLLGDEGVAIGDSGLIALDRYGWLPADATGRTGRSKRGSAGNGVAGANGTRRSQAAAVARRATAGSARAASPRRPPRSGSKRRASSSRR
jgi:methylated-DNA-protein-cysteine methyltransferase related protein